MMNAQMQGIEGNIQVFSPNHTQHQLTHAEPMIKWKVGVEDKQFYYLHTGVESEALQGIHKAGTSIGCHFNDVSVDTIEERKRVEEVEKIFGAARFLEGKLELHGGGEREGTVRTEHTAMSAGPLKVAVERK